MDYIRVGLISIILKFQYSSELNLSGNGTERGNVKMVKKGKLVVAGRIKRPNPILY